MNKICALNLKIYIQNTEIRIFPSEINLGIGEQTKYFRVSIPLEIEEQSIFINWLILGD